MADHSPEDEISRALETVEQRVSAAGGSPFTPQAYDLLKRRIAEYIGELVDESIRVARRRPSSDVVSTADVTRASEHLGVGSRSRRYQTIGTVGGILFGGGFGNALQLSSQPQITPEAVWLTFAAGAIGAVMMAVGYFRE